MVALKSSDIDAFVARPDPARPIVLVCGPDAGLIRERVDAILKSAVDDPNDPFSLARIDGDTNRTRRTSRGSVTTRSCCDTASTSLMCTIPVTSSSVLR